MTLDGSKSLLALVHILDVAPGTEGPARAGYDDRAGIGIFIHFDKKLFKGMVHFIINSIKAIGPVQGDGRYSFPSFHLNQFRRMMSPHADSSFSLSLGSR
jgi:hypothetical protein